MKMFAMFLVWAMGCLSLAATPGWAQRLAGQIGKSPTPDVQIQPIGIKRFGVAGPVTGSQDSIGVVELTGAARASGITVTLRSGDPGVATVPATVTVASGASGQNFKVTTFPVATPKTVTISAQVGTAPPQSVLLTIIPPTLEILSCQPSSLPVGAFTVCDVWLNGRVAGDSTVLISSPEYGTQIRPSVIVHAGEKKASFHVFGIGSGPQPRRVTVNASYGGVTKTVQVTVSPIALKDVIIQSLSFADFDTWISQGGDLHTGKVEYHGKGQYLALLEMRLNAPAPDGGLKVALSVYPPSAGSFFIGMVQHHGLDFSAGKVSQTFQFLATPVSAETSVRIIATAHFFPGSTEHKEVALTVPPARLTGLSYADDPQKLRGVPVGGAHIKMVVGLEGLAPPSGAPIALSYIPSNGITGPAVVTIPKKNAAEDFGITVFPCLQAGSCPVEIRATYLGQTKTYSMTLSP